MLLAAKAAELAKDLPDGAAIEVTVRVAIKKEHLRTSFVLGHFSNRNFQK